MPTDLTVAEGTTFVLDENPPAHVAEAFERVRIRALEDLVTYGAIESRATLSTLLDAARQVTDEALTNRATFSPFVRVPGTTRPDLRRFGSFVAATPDVVPSERETFWRLARGLDHAVLASIAVEDRIAIGYRPTWTFERFSFNDIVVEANGTLEISSNVQQLVTNNLLIHSTGRIVVHGGGVTIKAFSIQGEQ